MTHSPASQTPIGPVISLVAFELRLQAYLRMSSANSETQKLNHRNSVHHSRVHDCRVCRAPGTVWPWQTGFEGCYKTSVSTTLACHFQVLYVEDGTCDTHFLPSEILTDILAKSPTEMFEMNGSKARTWLIPRECVGYYGSPIQVSDPTTFRT